MRDEHGVHDLLAQVSKRNLSLGKKNVAPDVNPEDTPSETTSPKKSLADYPNNYNHASNGNPSAPKWGKGLFQRFNIPTIQQRDPTTPKPDAKEFFQRSSQQSKAFFQNMGKKMQSPLKQSADGGEAEQQPSEMKKAFERSSQQSKVFFQNMGKKMQQIPLKKSADGEDTDQQPSEMKQAFERSSQQSKVFFQNMGNKFQTFSHNLQTNIQSNLMSPSAKAAAVSEQLKNNGNLDAQRQAQQQQQRDDTVTSEEK